MIVAIQDQIWAGMGFDHHYFGGSNTNSYYFFFFDFIDRAFILSLASFTSNRF